MNQRMYRAWCEVIGAGTSYFVPFHAGSEKIGPEYVIIAFQQATGAADSNGKPIFEGDVVEYTQGLFNMDPARFPRKRKVVEYDTREARFNLYETQAGQSDFVVLGNIFENPELLDENGRAKQPEKAPQSKSETQEN